MDLLESGSIVSASQACLRLFMEYKANLGKASTSQNNSPAENNVSTFSLWARSIGALVHGGANADRRLKDFPDIKRTIIDLLIALQISLQRLLHQGQSNRGKKEPVLSDGKDESNYSITGDVHTSKDSKTFDDTKSDENWQDVERNLEYLTRIAIAVRRAGAGFRDARAERFREFDTSDLREETLLALKSIEITSIFKNAGRTDEGLLPESSISSELHVRLAECNERRRRRFYYLGSRHKAREGRPSIESQKVTVEEIAIKPTQISRHIQISQPQPKADLTTEIFIPPSASRVSQSSTAITPIARNEYKPPLQREDASSQAIAFQAGSFIASKFKMQYPPAPKLSHGAHRVECNICYELLPARDIKKWWSKHVKADLRPYVCLMSNCAEPYETFHMIKEWLKHMEKDHRENIVQWTCRASKHATRTLYSAEEFEKHMETEHPKSFTKAQLPALLKRCGVPAPQMFSQCPLCSWFPGDGDVGANDSDVVVDDNGAPLPIGPSGHVTESEASGMKKRLKLERHIADHLLTIALMSLLSREKDFLDQSIESILASSTSSDCVRSVSDISDFDNYFDNTSQEIVDITAEDQILDRDPPDWDQVYWVLSERNKLPLRFFGPLVENNAFTERPVLFREILMHSKRSSGFSSTKKVVLTGAHGIGKTELVKKYVHRSRRHRPQRYIFWIPGDSLEAFHKAYIAIASVCWIQSREHSLLESDSRDSHLVDLIKTWLGHPERGEWLMVIDSVKINVKGTFTEENFWDYIPDCGHGCVLITTQDETFASKSSTAVKINVGPMTNEEGVTFIHKAFQEDDLYEDGRYIALVQHCRGIPLLLQEACTSIQQGGLTIEEFIQGDLQTTEQETRNIIAWLSPLNFWPKQYEIFARRQNRTSQWIFEEPAFKAWLDGSERVLWCPGLPGAGKTVITSVVIDYLERTFKDEVGIQIIFIYCNYKEKESQNAVSLIASLLKQLIQRQQVIPSQVYKLYQKHLSRNSRPSFSEYSELLNMQLAACSKSFVIVDALDEYDDNSRTQSALIAELLKLPQSASLMFTSGYIPSIESQLHGSCTLKIRASDIDIKMFLEERIEESSSLKSHIQTSPILRDTIFNTIVAKADGLFFLAQLHMESLARKPTRKLIRAALEDLTNRLDSTYDEAMERINSQDEDTVQLAIKILMWMSYAVRPLAVQEIQYAIAVEVGDKKLDKKALLEEEFLTSICAGLVTIDRGRNVIRFVHYTTEEYFARNRLTMFPNGQTSIAKTCLTYLSFDVFKTGYCPSDEKMELRFRQNPFLHYTAEYWGIHAKAGEIHEIKSQVLEFLAQDSKLYCAAQVIDLPLHRNEGYSQAPSKKVSGLWLSALFGLTDIVQLLLEQNVDVNVRTSRKETALHRAALKGHKMVVQLLLKKGAQIEATDDNGRTALHWAASDGHKAVMQLLLDEGAYFEAKDEYGRTALYLATSNGHETVVRLLLERGADFEAKDEYGRTALYLAASNGHNAVVQLLLEKGADIKAKDNYGKTALHWAASNGHKAVVQLLLEKGADFEAKDEYRMTTLHQVASSGHEAVVQLLLEKGADIKAKDEYGRTALHQAALEGHEAVVRLLLEKGADIEAEDKNGWTALYWAAESGYESVVRLLALVTPNS